MTTQDRGDRDGRHGHRAYGSGERVVTAAHDIGPDRRGTSWPGHGACQGGEGTGDGGGEETGEGGGEGTGEGGGEETGEGVGEETGEGG